MKKCRKGEFVFGYYRLTFKSHCAKILFNKKEKCREGKE